MNERFVPERVVAHRREPFRCFLATRATDALPKPERYATTGVDDGLRAA